MGRGPYWSTCGWLALGGVGKEGEPSIPYLRARYWCATTLTTVGYGDISPTTDAQTASVILVTLVRMGLYISIAAHIMHVLVYKRVIRQGVVHSQNPDRLW